MVKNLLTALFLICGLVACNTSNQVSQTAEPQPVSTANTPVKTPRVSLNDIWTGKFSASGVYGLNPMNDGKSFSKIEGSTIGIYDFSSGRKLESIDLGRGFSSYEFSPDEKQVLFATDSERIYRHSTKATYFVHDVATGKTSEVQAPAKQTYPTFSPDGRKVAFVSDNNIHVFDIASGSTKQVTTDGKWNHIINGMSDWVYEEEFVLTRAFEWSPDSKKIAYYKFDEAHVKQFTMDFFGELYPEPYTFKYPKAGEQNSFISIYSQDLATGKNTRIDLGEETDIYFPRIKWTPNNQLVVFRMNRHQNELELLLANASGNTRPIYKETNKYYISESVLDHVDFLEDNSGFLWSSEKDGYKHVYLLDMEGNVINQVTTGNWDVTDLYGIDEANGKVFFQAAAESPLNREVYSIDLDGKNLKKLTPDAGWNSAEFTDSYDYFVHNYSSTAQPTTVVVRDRNGSEERQLKDNATVLQRVNKLGLPGKEFFSFTTSQGVELNGWMIKPSDFDPNKAYPVLMYVYGGPGSQTVQNRWYGANDLWYTHLADQGYIVASVDNRGTGARGQEFKKGTYLELGKLETIDQIEAGKYLGSQSYIDADRIGIWGWSYGGYMSSLALLKGNDVFKMAIAVAPVTTWRYYDTIYTERYMRTPQENASGYDDNSPINHVSKLKGSYLLVHGMADDNVHFQNSVDMVDALNKAGKHYDFYMYPNKNHGIYGGNTRLHLYEKMTDFILENL